MKLTSYARNLHELGVMRDLGYEEVILEPKALSRFGKLSDDEFMSLAKRAKDLGLRVLMEWDVLMTQDVFAAKEEVVTKLLPFSDAVRVQDPGALHWMISKTKTPVQFIAENGNHNLSALNGWIELSEGRMERVILSIELSKNTIADYAKNLKIPCELLGFGRIILFYTPRPLLSSLTPEKVSQNEEILALGESEESPHKGFPLIENQHGTFMFHIKEFCLIEYASDLKMAGLAFFRIDQRFGSDMLREASALVHNFSEDEFINFKESYPQDLMRGFYLVNKTDVLFPKLKNSRLQQREGNYLGEIIEAEKSSHLAVMIKNKRGMKRSDVLKIIHPKGDVFETKIFSLRNLALEEVDEIAFGELALVQYVGGVWVKSQVFFN